jgi:hypothetical protein
MALNQSPKIVTDGLVFYYDMNNGKSFVGGPVTNTLPSPAINGLPTIGNGWGTYNTNQYNGNAYFSIGSISSVASNIVTTSGNHPLRSYDVVTPQTSGGGVSAGTNYLVKKLSNTTFSLHPWNGSQDGSQGFINPATGNHKVYDDFANDVRIAINASSFPTMWWGPPHQPNSALVKEIIPNGFTGIPGRPPTDCIRLHFNRTDATDGMAYNPDAAVVAGTPYTVSFWARSVTTSAVGTTGSYQIYNYGVTDPSGHSIGYTLGPVGEWRKYTLTFTPNNPLAISYWFPGSGGIKYDIANIQFEAGSVANNFAPGTRANTQSILDITGNNTITANSLTYSSDGTFSFNGSNNYISCPPGFANFTGGITLSAWAYYSSSDGGWTRMFDFGNGNPSDNFLFCRHSTTSNLFWGIYPGSGSVFVTGGNITFNGWAMYTATADGSNMRIYVNGVLAATLPTSQLPTNITRNNNYIGRSNWADPYLNGNISIGQIYNRALTATEVQQNFNAVRSKFGI